MRITGTVVFRHGSSQGRKIFLAFDFFKNGIANKIGNGFALELRILAHYCGIDVVNPHRHRRHGHPFLD